MSLEKFKPELPPRLTFAKDLEELYARLFQVALSQLDLTDEERTFLISDYRGVDFDGVHFDLRRNPNMEKSVDAKILGSDGVILSELNELSTPPDFEKEGLYVDLILTKDGSPYVLEEDLELHDRFYRAFATTDGPPAIINCGYLRSFDNNARSLYEARIEVPDRFHELTDGECEALLTAIELSSKFIDTSAMRIHADDM